MRKCGIITRKLDTEGSYKFFSEKENQLKFTDQLYKKLGYSSFDDWKRITKKTIIQKGGRNLIYFYFNDLNALFANIYPNYPWGREFFKDSIKKVSKCRNIKELSFRYFKERKNQVDFLENLYYKLNLKSLDDWMNVTKRKMIDNGGKNLLYYYSNDINALLASIYPNFSFNIYKQKTYYKKDHFKDKENQVEYLIRLFYQWKLETMDDWLKISKKKLMLRSGGRLLELYQHNLLTLFSSLFPNFPWPFLSDPNNNYYSHYYKSKEKQQDQLRALISKYKIERKEDFYRISQNSEQINLTRLFRSLFGDEKWKKGRLNFRSKKTNQRFIFSAISHSFPQLHIYENYFGFTNSSPKTQQNNQKHLDNALIEFDIYISELNIAVEYQGEHHYYPISPAFSDHSLYLFRDQRKMQFSVTNEIQLIRIPYWLFPSSHSQSISMLTSYLYSLLYHHIYQKNVIL